MLKFIFLSLLLLLTACSDSESSASSGNGHDENVLDGFIRIEISNEPVVLGTNQDNAWFMDKPEMSVYLDYSYQVARHEVTCKDFSDYLTLPQSISCKKDEVLTLISYYDAVRYANARSKAEKMDTVYSYSKEIFDQQGNCINLVGLQFNPEVEGFRLPTEAEWIRAFTKVYFSGPVLDNFSFFVKEWVNDWLGSLRDTSVTNYVGAIDGGSLDEHVVKGGDFSSGMPIVNLYSRGDIYKVSASSRNPYVGFRLAYGKIPGALWLDKSGASTDCSMSVLQTPQDIYGKLKSYRVKLAFRNNLTGNLVFVNFNDGKPRVIELQDSLEVYHPDISPDGNWVAFSTGSEGISGKSEIYVRRLSENGGGAFALKVESGAIPRFRITPEGDTVIVYVSDAGNNSSKKDFLAQSTWQVSFSNGSFGTAQKLFDGAYHGGISPDERLAVSGARLLRARKPASKSKDIFGTSSLDTVWFNEEQACNASLSQDGSNRTLFLDFGSEVGHKFVGTDYGVHEQLLIADSTGKLIQTVPSPVGCSFDHTEWVGKTGLVVSTLANASGNHNKIALVDISDSSFMELVAGIDLFHPVLWIDEKTLDVKIDKALDLDSAGLYLSNSLLLEDILWRYKMELLWQNKDSADFVVVGSSRPLDGIRPRIMKTPERVVNLAQTPNSIFVSRDLILDYILPHFSKMKYLVVSLDIDFWWMKDNGEGNFFKERYKNYPGFVYDKNHGYWQEQYPQGLYELTLNAPELEGGRKKYTEESGFEGSTCNDWGDEENPVIASDTTSSSDSLALETSFKAFQEILKSAQKKDVVVIGVIFPQSPAYAKTGAYGCHGIRRSLAAKIIDRLKEMESENFVLMDENKMGQHDYRSSMAANYDHLCYGGARLLSARLDTLIASLE